MSRRIADLLIKIGADSYEFQQKAQQVEKGLDSLTKRLDKVGKEMSLTVTAPLTALGVASLAVTAKFDEAMREVSTLSDGITQNFKGFNNEILALTKKIPIGATDAAKALYQIVSAGHDGANGMKVLEVAAKAAVAGVTDTATAADAITTLLNAYGLSTENADKLSDQLFTTVRLGKTTFGELGSNISTVAATAASFGIKTEEVLAAVATLTKMGVPTAQAMTQIRSAMIATADSLGDGAFKGKTLQEALQTMATNANGSFTALKKDAGRIEAVNAILALTGKNAIMAAADLEQLRNSTGATDAAYGKMADSFTNKLALFKNNVSAVMVQIGNALIPIAETVMNAINKVITALGNMSEPTRKVVVIIGIAVAAIGPLALGLGSLLKFLPLLKAGFTVLIAPIGAVRTAVQMLSVAIATNPIGLLLTALTAGVGLFLAFRKSTDDATQAAGEHTNKVTEEAKQVNLLIAKLSSANTSELERQQVLEELRKIQPAIVEGLTAEKVELETLIKRATEYNQQLVLRIALARKQDQVAAAIERQTEAGIKQVEKGWKFTEALDFVSQKVAETMKSFDDQLNKFLANSVSAAAEAIGQMITGDLGLEGLVNAVLLQLAGFLKTIGQQLIEFGIMIVAFKTTLKSVLANPWAAIAIGAAMVLAASVMTALINKNAQKNTPKLAKGGLAYGPTYAMVGDNPNASVDPEVIAPLSKLKSMMTGGGTQNIAITLGGQLTAKGRDLVYVLGKENFKR